MAAGIRRSDTGDGRYTFLRWYDPDTGKHRVRLQDYTKLVLRVAKQPVPCLQESRQDLGASGPVQFKIEARPQTYTFFYRCATKDAKWIELGQLSTRILVDQKSRESVYAGTHFGLYAQGHEDTSCSRPASFRFACFNPNGPGEYPSAIDM